MWRALQKEQAEVFGIRQKEATGRDAGAEAEAVVEGVSDMPVPVAPALVPAVVTQLLMFGASLETAQRRKVSRRPAPTGKASSQLALF